MQQNNIYCYKVKNLNRQLIRHFIFLLIAIQLVLSGCNPSPDINDPRNNNSDDSFQPRWVQDVRLSPSLEEYIHDNRVYETEHCLVFSDEASDDTKIQFGEMAEQAIEELNDFFMLSKGNSFTIRRDDSNSKIQVVCNRNDARPQQSFQYGFMLYTLDSPYCFATEENLYREIKHEMVHVFQMYMDGSSRRYGYGWFREGLAEYAADGGFFPQITTLSYFNELRLLMDTRNIHPLKLYWSQLREHPGEVHSAAYSMSGLAMRFLLDPVGRGKSVVEIKRLFETLKQNEVIAFDDAFRNHLGLDIHDFENGFYQEMPNYLSQTEN